jgi:hypothetical protein
MLRPAGCLLYIKLEILGVCVCSLIAQKRINRFVPNLACLFFEIKKRIYKGYNSEKVSWVRVPVKMVSVARKISSIEEQRKEQNCLI